MADAGRLYFRQLLAGRDIARSDPVAAQMANLTYLVGDRQLGEAVLVDPAYGVDELLDVLEADGMRPVGVLASHYHPDHVGGDLMGHGIEGIARLLERADVPVHVQEPELAGVVAVTGVDRASLVGHAAGDRVRVGEIEVELIHTPGHTPGSQCFLVDGRLVSGDTLFLEGCGRVDLPGSDPAAMYESLTTRLARVPDDTVLYPGHLYSPEPSATMAETRRSNPVFRIPSLEAWLSVFSGR